VSRGLPDRALRRIFVVLVPALISIGAKPVEPPPLTKVYVHRNEAFRFIVPEGWTFDPVKGDVDAVQTVGDGSVVRIIYRKGELGYDALHGSCLSERLVPEAEGGTEATSYEYDYEEGSIEGRRSLDSAFLVDYGVEVMGHRKWRQRNLTVVGGGHSLCLIAFTPQSVWKKSKAARVVVDAVLQNVKFKP
jgi:hypothetical protein